LLRKRDLADSIKWKEWKATIDIKTCWNCKKMHGKIFDIYEMIASRPSMHIACRRVIQVLKAVNAGFATDKGQDGADWHLKYYGKLPNYYIMKERALEIGWDKSSGNLHDIASGCMIGGGVYENDDAKLPEKPGRIWYEADINYTEGRRNSERIVYSNDGLIFVTYDNYTTFVEVR